LSQDKAFCFLLSLINLSRIKPLDFLIKWQIRRQIKYGLTSFLTGLVIDKEAQAKIFKMR